MERRIYTVTQVNAHIQSVIDGDMLLSGLCIQGEISNYKVYPSGHHYFSLKDTGGALRCVMFKSSAVRLRFRPENGMKVLAMGRISVYPRDGAYQLYCTGLIADGMGDLHVAFEQRKEMLAARGYFDSAHKKPIPQYPQRIAIVTSSAGAAIHDMLRILKKRYPIAAVRLLPVRVQGTEAPGEIAAAIDYVNRWALADLIITGRGGGSMEDLWAFNEEIVAQAIYRSEIPIISAVGHEPDVTISDYVADLRAATPSNAAELAVPDRLELAERLQSAQSSMAAVLLRQLHSARKRLELLRTSRPMKSPVAALNIKRQYLDSLQHRMDVGVKNRISAAEGKFSSLAAALDAMSPLKVLGRGYAIARLEDGQVVRSVKQTRQQQTLHIRLLDGTIRTRIWDITPAKEEDDLG